MDTDIEVLNFNLNGNYGFTIEESEPRPSRLA